MPTYNSAALLLRAVESVLSQDVDEEIELLLIDDGSSDATLSIIKSLSDSRVVFHQREVNGGAGAARKDGIMMARGHYLAFLDSDDYWIPGFLSLTKNFLDAHDEVVAVNVLQNHIISPRQQFLRPDITDVPKAWVAGIVLDDFFTFWAEHDHVCTGSVLMRSAPAKDAQGMRADLRISQDLEFWGLIATYGQWGYIHQLLFVSDGLQVSMARGWLKKNMIRWISAPTVEVWQERIVSRLSDEQKTTFQKIQGKMARNFAYCMILSSREPLALSTVRKYESELPEDRLSKLFVNCIKYRASWWIMCKGLKARELSRALWMYALSRLKFR